jgi:uncharacterized protein
MTANLAAFAIHVDDIDRARAFYEGVFDWVFEPWGPPGFYLIHTGDEASPGIQGLMHKRLAAKVVACGGTITHGPSTIPTVGTLLRFDDTEGNDVGAMKYEKPMHT